MEKHTSTRKVFACNLQISIEKTGNNKKRHVKIYLNNANQVFYIRGISSQFAYIYHMTN